MKLKKLLLLGAALACCSTIAGCGKDKAGGSKKVQIVAYKAGYGIDWLNDLIRQFNETFKSEGLTAELVEANSMVGTEADAAIQTPKKNQNDLYFLSNGNVSEHIAASHSKLHSSKKVLLEDLTDVYNSKAIGFDGKEESETIADRMFGGFKEYCTYNGYVEKWNGNMYELPWADSVLGILCNPAVLTKYGLDMPLTSNEFVACIQQISSLGASDQVYPLVYAGKNASGYWSYLYEIWFAQYTGVEQYQKFVKCEPASGDISNEGYKVYEDEGIEKALEGMFQILKKSYVMPQSSEYEHIDAQDEFIRGNAAFMVDGDWMLNEMKTEEADYNRAKNTILMKTPILSSIGTKLGLTDAQLHDLVKAIDEHKTLVEMKEAGFTETQIAKVTEARSTHNSLGTTHDIVIPEYADAKEAAKKFVRMMYSSDGCNVFRKGANANLPLRYTRTSEHETAFQDSVDAIYDYDNVYMISGDGELNDVRKLCKMYTFNYQSWAHPKTYTSILENPSVFVLDELPEDEKNRYNPKRMAAKEAEYMRLNWSAYMEAGGF